MKNIHILPTQKQSRLSIRDIDNKLCIHRPEVVYHGINQRGINQNIYITSDEKIKEGDWYYHLERKTVHNTSEKADYFINNTKYSKFKKIIITTDQDLIKDGVQSIDDEFLEWFVKNLSCEEVQCNKIIPYDFDDLNSVNQDKFLELFYKSELFDEIKYNDVFDWSVNEGKDFLKLYPTFKIIIQKEEVEKETLEEAIQKVSNSDEFNNGALFAYQWQQERMYSEEEVYDILIHHTVELFKKEPTTLEDFWNKFKKK